MELYKEFYLCLTGNVNADFKKDERYGKYYQFTPSLILNWNTKWLLLKYATGTGKTLAAIIIAKKYKKMGKKVLIISYIESWLNEDILHFYEYTNITREQKNILDKKERAYLESKNEQHKNAYLLYWRWLLNSVGIDIVGYKKFKTFVIDENGYLKTEYIETLKNSIIICDEIHNTYAAEDNTFYEAIQSVANYHGNNITLIYMSATPLLYSKNTSTIANYLTVITLTAEQKRAIKNNKESKSQDILKYNKYQNESELSVDDFNQVAKFC